MSDATPGPAPRERPLGTWDLVVFGILCVTPIAPLPLFGLAQQLSNGHAVTTILLAMFGMLLTAVSYGRMASVFPESGSAFSYIGRGLNPHLGFIAGWLMLFDYVLIPLINIIYCAVMAHRFAPWLPYPVAATAVAVVSTGLNLLGLRAGASANWVLLAGIVVVLAAFILAAIVFVSQADGPGTLVSTRPFYEASTFAWPQVLRATAFAALTYIGFDSVTTLAGEVKRPERSVPVATVLVCLLTGLGGGLLVYLAQLVWPQAGGFVNVETAFLDVTRRAGGAWLFAAMTVVLFVSQFASCLTGQAGAARVLNAMSRAGALPGGWFSRVNRLSGQPALAVIFVGLVALAGAFILSFERGGELLNFGAFVGFMGVNLATLKTFYFDRRGRGATWWRDALPPLIGLVACIVIWAGLPMLAKIVGSLWLVAGLVCDGVMTGGFRRRPTWFEVAADPAVHEGVVS